jgi:hypothetical protein
MSTGIFQGLDKIADVENRKSSAVQGEASSEQPTADLVAPGTGSKFSDEFACLLNVLGGERD